MSIITFHHSCGRDHPAEPFYFLLLCNSNLDHKPIKHTTNGHPIPVIVPLPSIGKKHTFATLPDRNSGFGFTKQNASKAYFSQPQPHERLLPQSIITSHNSYLTYPTKPDD